MEIKAVIFDIDGTLVSVGKDYSYIKDFHVLYKEVLKRFTGKDFSHLTGDEIYDTIRLPYNESVRILNGWGIKDPEEFWNVIEKEDLIKRKSMTNDMIFPYPDAVSLIKELKENGNSIKLGILANIPESVARAELEGTKLLRFFDHLCCFHYNSPNSKPSGWAIRKMLSEWGIPKESAWMFGDAEQDVEAGRDAGVWTGRVFRNDRSIKQALKPDVEGSDLLELWRKANEMQVRQEVRVLQEV